MATAASTVATSASSQRAIVNAICVIGAKNQPLFIKSFNTLPESSQLHYHYIAHISVDIIEEKVNGSKLTDLYLGLLYSMEDYSVYGYVTNTRVKFLIVIQLADFAVKDVELKNIFRKIHQAYVNLILNPFYDPESNQLITSKSFTKSMEELVTKP
ncbi:hypothetical protein SmJEL517_g01806 [Synchytrium microbalum]|uniref:Trafficking protein particle complex subunit 2-like protein n=1 Tax=Synchytrium microbalum TaxID=1806994 RepID=A0A507C4I6_9FUNG|nr:uncharacterized protein SmJEL517_g01806 [Synchytrium microbalum]TPX35887.1 hypothetical protein SmJEL517_g01806 [Synchytrium microbalum]